MLEIAWAFPFLKNTVYFSGFFFLNRLELSNFIA